MCLWGVLAALMSGGEDRKVVWRLKGLFTPRCGVGASSDGSGETEYTNGCVFIGWTRDGRTLTTASAATCPGRQTTASAAIWPERSERGSTCQLPHFWPLSNSGPITEKAHLSSLPPASSGQQPPIRALAAFLSLQCKASPLSAYLCFCSK